MCFGQLDAVSRQLLARAGAATKTSKATVFAPNSAHLSRARRWIRAKRGAVFVVCAGRSTAVGYAEQIVSMSGRPLERGRRADGSDGRKRLRGLRHQSFR